MRHRHAGCFSGATSGGYKSGSVTFCVNQVTGTNVSFNSTSNCKSH